jgi:hypothetical protein
MLVDMFKNTYARNDVKSALNSGRPNIIVQHKPVPIHHPPRPVVPYIVNSRYDVSACPQQMWQSGISCPNIEDICGLELRQLLKGKPIFNRPLVNPSEFLLYIFPLTLVGDKRNKALLQRST